MTQDGSQTTNPAQEVQAMLERLRLLRDATTPLSPRTQLRAAFNAACDRLDVLESKLREVHPNAQ